MLKLVKKDLNKENIFLYGNSFLLGNGHLGYRGTLEEYTKNQMVGLNIVGFYDKAKTKDAWRESLNAPNPFYIKVYSQHKKYDVIHRKPLFHKMELDINHDVFLRKTEFDDILISSKRFISQVEDNFLALEYKIRAKKDQKLIVSIGMDTDIYEIHGPHFIKKEIKRRNKLLRFKGLTNEKAYLYMDAKYAFPKKSTYSYENGIYKVNLDVKKNHTYKFYVFTKIYERHRNSISLIVNQKEFKEKLKNHSLAFENKMKQSDIEIKGNNKAQFALRYALYQLNILGNKNYCTSIPARGVSSPVYKGAIFWDTEIFLVPFFTLTDPLIAYNLLKYRINTLSGAINKAKDYGYKGAFYAWESQEDGRESCSKYNVSDPITNKPIRTYFNEAQIHISSDIAYAFDRYITYTNDTSLLKDGGINVLYQIVLFYMSWATYENNQYHFNKVIGPDEYHELVDDNAFTNYMIDEACAIFLKYYDEFKAYLNEEIDIHKIQDFKKKIYLPLPNEHGVIEQFKEYFDLEDISVNKLKKRVKNEKEYWGTKNGIAYPTRVIKQADTLALLVLLKERFTLAQIKANYAFYLPYTEHGSSLSTSLYSLVGFLLNDDQKAYELWLKSARIDLSHKQKLFAGGIYIGGSHPASAGGAYLSLLYGLLNLEIKDQHLILHPHKNPYFKEMKLKIYYQNRPYLIKIHEDASYEMEEII